MGTDLVDIPVTELRAPVYGIVNESPGRLRRLKISKLRPSTSNTPNTLPTTPPAIAPALDL